MNSSRRPLVVVEDHLYHIGQILDLLRRRQPDLLSQLTVVCLDRPGPDTREAVAEWTASFPEVLIVANVEPTDPERQRALPAAALEHEREYVGMVKDLLAPRGVLVQDIQLETLRFHSADQWWETIYLASSVRGRYAAAAPRCIFMSNKRAFHATFGQDLQDAGFDANDVLNKDELEDTLVPLLFRCLREAFPLELERSDRDRSQWLSADGEEAEALDRDLHVVLWEHRPAKIALTGRAVVDGRVELPEDGHEAATWRALVEAHLSGDRGIPTQQLGARVAPEHALRAEQINAASRHVYRLRARLRDKDRLLNADHHYRLADDLCVGRVRRRPRSPG